MTTLIDHNKEVDVPQLQFADTRCCLVELIGIEINKVYKKGSNDNKTFRMIRSSLISKYRVEEVYITLCIHLHGEICGDIF